MKKRLALCIGNNDYQKLSKLNYACNDAECMAGELKKLGYETKLKLNLNRDDMARIISKFTNEVEEYDSCVLYYAGHGFQVEGNNYLAPIDLDINEEVSAIKYFAYPLEDIMLNMDKYPQKTKVFIFDACRSTLGRGVGSSGFASVLAPQGSIISFATSPGQVSSEDPKVEHGLFTDCLLKNISLPRVNIETVFKKTREMMYELHGKKQTPWEHTSLIGDYYFNPNTIYDGFHYSDDALNDARYEASSADTKNIIDTLKIHNWYRQRDAKGLIEKLDFNETMANDLFVIGRNIYQSACGGCIVFRDFIEQFASLDILAEAKAHILNGMAYEIYFDSKNVRRMHPKVQMYNAVIQLLEREDCAGCREFIVSRISTISDKLLYVPGQKSRMKIIVDIDKDGNILHLYNINPFNGNTENVLFKGDGTKITAGNCDKQIDNDISLKYTLARELAIPNDYLDIEVKHKGTYYIPCDFVIKHDVPDSGISGVESKNISADISVS